MRILARVIPGSRENSVRWEGDKAVVRLKAQAKDGRANRELVWLMSRVLGQPVRIKSGLTSKNKILQAGSQHCAGRKGSPR